MRKYHYRDINEDNPNEKPDLFDVDAVVQGVTNFILTPKGSRLFNANYGSLIEGFLFDLMDEDAGLQILNELAIGIEEFDPRVTVDVGTSSVTPYEEENKFEFDIYFEIEGFDDKLFLSQGSLTR